MDGGFQNQQTREFNEPFYEATAALSSSFSPSVVGIAGVPYLIDTSTDNEGTGRYKREGFDVVQQRNTNDQRDLLLLPQDVWRQQAQTWSLGAGQNNYDRDSTLYQRFSKSYGINVWDDWKMSLLPSTARIPFTVDLTGSTWLTSWNGYLAVVNGQKVYWVSDVTASGIPTNTTISAGNTVVDIANQGNAVTALMSDYYIWTVAGPSAAPVKWSNQQWASTTTFIAWEKDYLIVGEGNILKNSLKNTGNAATLYTHPDSTFRWYSAASGNSHIYVLGRLSERTTIHRVGVKQDGSGLNTAVVAATLPDGEIGYSIDSYLGFIFIGTSKGVRMAAADAEGNLTLGSILPTATPVRCFEGQDRFVWYGDSAIDGAYSIFSDSELFPTGTVCGLSRMDLSKTTINALTPAYATDLAAVGQTNKTVQSVVTFEEKRVFSIQDGGVWYETTNLVPGGWLTQGIISYSVEDLKTGIYTQTKFQPLNGSISLDMQYDSTGFVRVATFPIQGSIRSGNVSMNGTQFSRIEPRFVLRRSDTDATIGPVMTRWEVRAIPVKGRNSRWTLPIVNREEIEIDGVTYTRNPLDVLDSLMSLVEGGTLFTLQESNRSHQVHAKDFMWVPDSLTSNGRAWQGVFTLVVEEVA